MASGRDKRIRRLTAELAAALEELREVIRQMQEQEPAPEPEIAAEPHRDSSEQEEGLDS